MAEIVSSNSSNSIGTRKDYEKALGLLEAYEKAIITSSNESNNELKGQLQALICVLKSNLFGALVDIQEYYEDILRDISSNPEIVREEAEMLSKRWNTSR